MGNYLCFRVFETVIKNFLLRNKQAIRFTASMEYGLPLIAQDNSTAGKSQE